MTGEANAVRGEVALTLDGEEFVLRPTYDAIVAFEDATGRGLVTLAQSASDGSMRLPEAAAIVTACVRAWGQVTGNTGARGVNAKRIGELILETKGGLMVVLIRLAAMLLHAASGGYTASGEVKAASDMKATPAAA